MKLKNKYRNTIIPSGLALGIVLVNIPVNSFADNIKMKDDLQNSIQELSDSEENTNWITGLSSMPTPRRKFTAQEINNKIYCIGGMEGTGTYEYSREVEIYDIETDTWTTGAKMPTHRKDLSSVVYDEKIYCFGGRLISSAYSNILEVYDPKTDTWETKTPMPRTNSLLATQALNGKIYCIGGYGGGAINPDSYSTVDIYDIETDTWTTGAEMPSARYYLSSVVVDNKIYCVGSSNNLDIYDVESNTWERKTNRLNTHTIIATGVINDKIYCIGTSQTTNFIEIYDIKTDTWTVTDNWLPTPRGDLASILVDNKIYCIGGDLTTYNYTGAMEAYEISIPTPESEAKDAVIKAEESKNVTDIEDARDLVNKLEESDIKNELQNRLDAIIPNITLTSNSATANLDVYIKSENSLVMTLDSNSITFDGFSSVENMVQEDAVTVTIKSSLPYELNSYLVQEITNIKDDSKTLDKSILNIKANGEDDYNTFEDIGTTPILLLDNQTPGETNEHGIDFMLDADIPYENGNYKTVIKFEAQQK